MFKIGSIFISDNMFNQYAGLYNALRDKTPNLLSGIREKKNTTIATQLDSRTLNYWTQRGIVDNNVSDVHAQWHKFSFVDIVFIYIAKKLRDFGMGIEQIKKAKISLFDSVFITKPNGEGVLLADFSVLEAAILFAFVLNNHGNIFLVVQSDGTCACMTDADIVLNRNEKVFPDDYISINMNAMLQKNNILGGLQAQIKQGAVEMLVQNGEKQVLDALRQPETTEIVVKKNVKTGKIVDLDTMQEISDVSNMPEFGDVQIKRQDGKTVNITRRTHTKIK